MSDITEHQITTSDGNVVFFRHNGAGIVEAYLPRLDLLATVDYIGEDESRDAYPTYVARFPEIAGCCDLTFTRIYVPKRRAEDINRNAWLITQTRAIKCAIVDITEN